jgi:hypothetical protein
MSVPLYMDHHVKSAVTDGLRKRGVDVLTTQLGRATFSQDDDFLVLADEWLANGRDFAGVIYAPQLGITIGQAIRDLELIAKVLEPADMKNRIEFLPY